MTMPKKQKNYVDNSRCEGSLGSSLWRFVAFASLAFIGFWMGIQAKMAFANVGDTSGHSANQSKITAGRFVLQEAKEWPEPGKNIAGLSWAEALRLMKSQPSTAQARAWAHRYALAQPLETLNAHILSHPDDSSEPLGEQESMLMRALLFRWSELDPETLLQNIAAIAPAMRRHTAKMILAHPSMQNHLTLQRLMEAMPANESFSLKQMALDLASDMPSDSPERREISRLFGFDEQAVAAYQRTHEWMRQGPEFLRQLLENPDPDSWNEEQKEMAQNMCSMRPEAFLMMAASDQGAALARNGFFDEHISYLQNTSPEAFVGFLKTAAGAAYLEDSTRMTGLCYSAQDKPWLLEMLLDRCDPAKLPEGARGALLRGAAKASGTDSWRRLLSIWPKTDISNAFAEWIREKGARDPGSIAGDFPLATASMDAKSRLHATRITAETLCREDMSSALAWAQTLSGEARQTAENSVLQKLAEIDPQQGVALLSDPSLLSGLEGQTVAKLAGRYAEADPVRAAEWAQSLPPTQQSAALLGILSGKMDEAQAARELDAILQGDLPPELLPVAAQQTENFATRWASENPSDALNWLLGMENQHIASPVAERLAGQWAADDAVGMAEWLAQRPASAQDDIFITQLASQLGNDPEAAFYWAQRLTNPEDRSLLGAKYLALLSQQNPQAALSAKASLPAERQREIEQAGATMAQ